MKNYDLRLKQLEGTINVYKGLPTIFIEGDDLQEQVEQHNKTTGEKLSVNDVEKWKKAKKSKRKSEWGAGNSQR